MADSRDMGDLAGSRMARINSGTMPMAGGRYGAGTSISWLTDVIVVPHCVFRETGEYAISPSGMIGYPFMHELHLRLVSCLGVLNENKS
jgi:hypothetical protein